MSDATPKATQGALFPQAEPTTLASDTSPLVPLPPIDAATSLAGLALPYRQYLLLSDHTTHTVDCFLSDLRLFARFVGQDAPVGNMTNAIILRWLQHLRWESEMPPAPKTLARRVTFLKNFF